MSEHLDKARDLHAAIAEVLLREWDPIGVADVPQAQDEYDSYVPEIYAMLIRREPRAHLIAYLRWAETDHMGLQGNREKTARIADRLRQLAN